MIRNTIKIWETGEYDYELAFGFEPTVDGYLHDEASDNLRPCLLVVPGGAYRFVSPSEAEPVARVFYELGYNVFVLTYTTDVTMTLPLHLQPLKDISRQCACCAFVRLNLASMPARSRFVGFRLVVI
jgi:hypothetical protein